jgi:hypothetical protein
MKSSLSPAAQAILDAYGDFEAADTDAMAAALRAVADEVAPFEAEDINGCWYEKRNPVREQLFAIAVELEGSNG